MSQEPLLVAVIDDYHSLAKTYLDEGSIPANVKVTIFTDTLPSTPIQPLVDRLKPYSVICIMRERTPFRHELVEQLPNLKFLLSTGGRNNSLDLDALKERGVVVGCTGGSSLPNGSPPDLSATVQHTWALILSLTTNIVRDHALATSPSSWLGAMPLNKHIGGSTLGIFGLGKLGAGTARIGKMAFGMKIIAWSPNLTQARADDLAVQSGLSAGDYVAVSKEELFKQSDILSVHIVLSDTTRGIVSEKELGWMKPSSYLINTSRGPLIDESALLETLEQGKITGAALDVFDVEPLPANSRWRSDQWGKGGRSQVVLTPHSGYSYDATLSTMWESTREHIRRITKGEDLEPRLI